MVATSFLLQVRGWADGLGRTCEVAVKWLSVRRRWKPPVSHLRSGGDRSGVARLLVKTKPQLWSWWTMVASVGVLCRRHRCRRSCHSARAVPGETLDQMMATPYYMWVTCPSHGDCAAIEPFYGRRYLMSSALREPLEDVTYTRH
jgi:hypothetical protein